MFAERYSMGIDDFYALTLRQIVQIKRVIERKKLIDREWQAMLENKKLKQTHHESILSAFCAKIH